MEGNREAEWCEILAELYSDFCLDTSQPDTVMKEVQRRRDVSSRAASQPASLGDDQVYSAMRAAPSIPPFALEHSFRIEQQESPFPTAKVMCCVPDRAKATAWEATWCMLSTISSTKDLLLVFHNWLEKSWDEQNDFQFLIAEGISTTDFPCLTRQVASSSEGFQR